MKTGEVIKQFVIFHPFDMGFAKMVLATIFMLQSLKTGPHFFHKGPNYQLKWFLGPNSKVKVPKNAEMCQILANFSVT